MHRSAMLVTLLLFDCGSSSAQGAQNSNPPAIPRPACAGCGPLDEATRQREWAIQQAAGQRLREILRAGPGDPITDARAAADSGNFRLIWSSAFGGHSVIGADCRFPGYRADTSLFPLHLATRSHSDAVGVESAEQVMFARRMDQYALAYNRAIIADPRFPYPDLCDTNPSSYVRRGGLSGPTPELLASSHRVETDAPRNLGEAVRRGSRQSVVRLLRQMSGAELNRLDDLGLTPLGWAVIERRDAIARILLTHGADPLGGAASNGHIHFLPLTIALTTGQNSLADAMLTPSVIQRVMPWPPRLMEAAVRGGHAALVRRMLADLRPGTIAPGLIALAQEQGDTETLNVLLEGSPGAGLAAVQAAIWRDNPRELQGALALSPDLGPYRNRRRSPLGDAVQRRHTATDEIVRLLLAAGADPESPAEWEDSHPTGSRPPTVLVTLVAMAQRIYPGGSWNEANIGIASSQMRAIDRLIAAGASIDATDAHGRPLAVVAIAGQLDPLGGVRTQQQLAPGWLTRLAGAGMDVNATWLGSSALDWLYYLEMSETPMAQELVRLGGRRVQAVPARDRTARSN